MDKPQRFLDLDYRIRRATLILLYLAAAGLLAVMLYFARPVIQLILTVLSPFIVALIVAYIFNPIVNFLQKRFHVGRISGVIITYGLILLIAVGFFALLLPILYGQLRDGITSVIHNFPAMIDKASKWLRLRVSPEELEQAESFIRSNIDIGTLTGKAGTAVGQAFDTTKLITKAIGTSISLVVGGIAFLVFVVVICFYFLLDYHRLEHIARVLLPEDKESRVFTIWAKIDEALGGYLRGQLIVATVVGIIYAIALSCMGMNQYAILIAFLAGLGNMIPYCGPIIGGLPTALWVIFGSEFDGTQSKLLGIGMIVGLSIAVQTLDGLYMQPRIVGKNAELHPLLVLLALLIGAQFGIGGMIIAVPVAIMARVILKEIWWDPLEQQEYLNKHPAVSLEKHRNVDSTQAISENSMQTENIEILQPESEKNSVSAPDIPVSTFEKDEKKPNHHPGSEKHRSSRRRKKR